MFRHDVLSNRRWNASMDFAIVDVIDHSSLLYKYAAYIAVEGSYFDFSITFTIEYIVHLVDCSYGKCFTSSLGKLERRLGLN